MVIAGDPDALIQIQADYEAQGVRAQDDPGELRLPHR